MNRAADYLPAPAPTVPMPRNQFEPAIDFCAAYERATGNSISLDGVIAALGDERLALCPERRRGPR